MTPFEIADVEALVWGTELLGLALRRTRRSRRASQRQPHAPWRASRESCRCRSRGRARRPSARRRASRCRRPNRGRARARRARAGRAPTDWRRPRTTRRQRRGRPPVRPGTHDTPAQARPVGNMKSRSGSAETDAYVFLISLFRTSTSIFDSHHASSHRRIKQSLSQSDAGHRRSSVAEDGRALADPLPQGSRTGKPGVGELGLVELLRVEADRASSSSPPPSANC